MDVDPGRPWKALVAQHWCLLCPFALQSTLDPAQLSEEPNCSTLPSWVPRGYGALVTVTVFTPLGGY